MVWIPAGTFLMGTNDKESYPNERPAHFVQVQGFWMESIPTSRPHAKTSVAISVVRLRVMIQAIRTLPSASSRVADSFAAPPTARIFAPARVAEDRPTPVRPIRTFGA